MTLPKDVRNELNVKDGDEINFILQDGIVYISKNEESKKKSRFTVIKK